MDYNYTYDYTTPTTTSSVDPAVALGIGIGFIIFTLVLSLAIYALFAFFLSKIFKKAGVPAWAAWVPIYNQWKILEIGGQAGYWSVLGLLPIVGIVSAVFQYIAMYHIGKKLGKEGVFVLLAIFLPYVWVIWLGIDKSKWNDKGSTAPSLHKPIPSA